MGAQHHLEIHFFKFAIQFRITVGLGDVGSPINVPIRNR
jgi:hypothetical protein